MRLYNDGCTIREIKKKLGLPQSQYAKIFRKVRDKGLVTPRLHRRKKQKKPVKNYSFDTISGHFHVTKNNQYYACVKTEEQAQRMVELFKENKWDYSKRHIIKQKVLGEFK